MIILNLNLKDVAITSEPFTRKIKEGIDYASLEYISSVEIPTVYYIAAINNSFITYIRNKPYFQTLEYRVYPYEVKEEINDSINVTEREGKLIMNAIKVMLTNSNRTVFELEVNHIKQLL